MCLHVRKDVQNVFTCTEICTYGQLRLRDGIPYSSARAAPGERGRGRLGRGHRGRGERPAGRAELLAKRPYWTGPPLSAPRCRHRADRSVFFLAARAFWKNPGKPWSKFAKIQILEKISKISAIFNENFEIEERCKGVHCVDLGESFPTSIYLQNLASIQPRTSLFNFN